jgi:hypothetical protein
MRPLIQRPRSDGVEPYEASKSSVPALVAAPLIMGKKGRTRPEDKEVGSEYIPQDARHGGTRLWAAIDIENETFTAFYLSQIISVFRCLKHGVVFDMSLGSQICLSPRHHFSLRN